MSLGTAAVGRAWLNAKSAVVPMFRYNMGLFAAAHNSGNHQGQLHVAGCKVRDMHAR